MTKKRIGVVLSGCGVQDGSEIHEATLTLYFLDRAQAGAVPMAPNVLQQSVVNHLTGQQTSETRHVLVESARIARGNIQDLALVRAEDLDGIILPGGFGAAKNLSSIASDGANAWVNEDLHKLLVELHRSGKPIGAICIAPMLVSKVLSGLGVALTIGDDAQTAKEMEAMGNRHQNSTVDQIVIDHANKIVTTAAYMCATSIGEAGIGIEKLVSALLEMA
ncbi:MAG: isoprenoid biosynthesis glyoxalase ElbB [Magnetococcus sp. DMHC-6]